MLATGGIGKAYKITSNSWEYTGDGHTLAYDAGAELQDMEFVQFHPTGMIWPPSVQGILVTEGVRGEGGILLNSKGEQFMYNDIPDAYRNQTAKDPEEGWRYCQGDRNANRPAELLTRDHVARCILREVRAGRGTPHGGVWLDISWIKKKIANAPEHIKRKLPSMYHQFKELGGIDITKEAMEVGPTTHYIMGGVRVDAESQMSRVPGLFACGECAVGINGANRLGGNSLSDLLVFGKRAGEFAGKYAKDQAAPQIHDDQIQEAARWALAPFERHWRHRGAVRDPAGSAGDDAGPGGHRSAGRGDAAGPGGAGEVLQQRAARAKVTGNREYNPGWHTALDLHNLLTVSEAIAALRHRPQGEPRRPLPRRLPRQGRSLRQDQPGGAQSGRRPNAAGRSADPRDAGRAEANYRGDEVMTSLDVVPAPPLLGPARTANGDVANLARRRQGRQVRGLLPRRLRKGWSCSTRCIRCRPNRPTTWRCAGTARRASAAPAPPRSTASRR